MPQKRKTKKSTRRQSVAAQKTIRKEKQPGLALKYARESPFGNHNSYVYEQPEQKHRSYQHRVQLAKARSRYYRTNHQTVYTKPANLSDAGPSGVYRDYDDLAIASLN
jgi:hypothetical protein